VHRALAILALSGCAAAPIPCASSLACGPDRACGLDGRCGARAGFDRSQRSAWAAPARWAATVGHRPSISDRAELGEGRAMWLEFTELPDAVRSILVLPPHARGTTRGAALAVLRIADGAELARARALPGPSRPVRVDLTGRARHGRLAIVVRSDRALWLATPLHADPASRPRLELALR
jgi:hypothetical protein